MRLTTMMHMMRRSMWIKLLLVYHLLLILPTIITAAKNPSSKSNLGGQTEEMKFGDADLWEQVSPNVAFQRNVDWSNNHENGSGAEAEAIRRILGGDHDNNNNYYYAGWTPRYDANSPYANGMQSTGETWDSYQLAWRLLGFYIDCDYNGDESSCQRMVLYAVYVDPAYEGGGLAEYEFYHAESGQYLCYNSNGGGCRAKMDCHSPDTDWQLMGIFKISSISDNNGFMEQLFKHEGVCVWGEDTYKFASQMREKLPRECSKSKYYDPQGNYIYYDSKPAANGNITIGFYSDQKCSIEYEGNEVDIYTVTGYTQDYFDNFNEALDTWKICQPCTAYNLNYYYYNFYCYDEAGYENCNQCMKFSAKAGCEIATSRDIALAERQETLVSFRMYGSTLGAGSYSKEDKWLTPSSSSSKSSSLFMRNSAPVDTSIYDKSFPVMTVSMLFFMLSLVIFGLVGPWKLPRKWRLRRRGRKGSKRSIGGDHDDDNDGLVRDLGGYSSPPPSNGAVNLELPSKSASRSFSKDRDAAGSVGSEEALKSVVALGGNYETQRVSLPGYDKAEPLMDFQLYSENQDNVNNWNNDVPSNDFQLYTERANSAADDAASATSSRSNIMGTKLAGIFASFTNSFSSKEENNLEEKSIKSAHAAEADTSLSHESNKEEPLLFPDGIDIEHGTDHGDDGNSHSKSITGIVPSITKSFSSKDDNNLEEGKKSVEAAVLLSPENSNKEPILMPDDNDIESGAKHGDDGSMRDSPMDEQAAVRLFLTSSTSTSVPPDHDTPDVGLVQPTEISTDLANAAATPMEIENKQDGEATLSRETRNEISAAMGDALVFIPTTAEDEKESKKQQNQRILADSVLEIESATEIEQDTPKASEEVGRDFSYQYDCQPAASTSECSELQQDSTESEQLPTLRGSIDPRQITHEGDSKQLEAEPTLGRDEEVPHMEDVARASTVSKEIDDDEVGAPALHGQSYTLEPDDSSMNAPPEDEELPPFDPPTSDDASSNQESLFVAGKNEEGIGHRELAHGADELTGVAAQNVSQQDDCALVDQLKSIVEACSSYKTTDPPGDLVGASSMSEEENRSLGEEYMATSTHDRGLVVGNDEEAKQVEEQADLLNMKTGSNEEFLETPAIGVQDEDVPFDESEAASTWSQQPQDRYASLEKEPDEEAPPKKDLTTHGQFQSDRDLPDPSARDDLDPGSLSDAITIDSEQLKEAFNVASRDSETGSTLQQIGDNLSLSPMDPLPTDLYGDIDPISADRERDLYDDVNDGLDPISADREAEADVDQHQGNDFYGDLDPISADRDAGSSYASNSDPPSTVDDGEDDDDESFPVYRAVLSARLEGGTRSASMATNMPRRDNENASTQLVTESETSKPAPTTTLVTDCPGAIEQTDSADDSCSFPYLGKWPREEDAYFANVEFGGVPATYHVNESTAFLQEFATTGISGDIDESLDSQVEREYREIVSELVDENGGRFITNEHPLMQQQEYTDHSRLQIEDDRSDTTRSYSNRDDEETVSTYSSAEYMHVDPSTLSHVSQFIDMVHSKSQDELDVDTTSGAEAAIPDSERATTTHQQYPNDQQGDIADTSTVPDDDLLDKLGLSDFKYQFSGEG